MKPVLGGGWEDVQDEGVACAAGGLRESVDIAGRVGGRGDEVKAKGAVADQMVGC